MVVVKNIEESIFTDMGFISKKQALTAYNGIKSLKGECLQDFLNRTYPLVKDVIYDNKIKDLMDEESSLRYYIDIQYNKQIKDYTKEFTKHRNYRSIAKINKLKNMEIKMRNIIEKQYMNEFLDIKSELSKINCYVYRYDLLLKNYRLIITRLQNTENEYINLLSENRMLRDEINKNTNCDKIMSLNTKYINTLIECAICSNDIINEPVYDICHTFHIRCITLWLIKNNTCPCCRHGLF